MNVIDLAREYFPLFSDDHLGQIIMTCTAWPATNEEPFLRKQLDSIQRRSGGRFTEAMRIAHEDLDAAMDKRITDGLSTYELLKLREKATKADSDRSAIYNRIRELEKELILRVEEWAPNCDCEFNYDGMDFTLWPKTLNSFYTGYIDMGDGITFYAGSFSCDKLETMKAFIQKYKFRSVVIAPIHREVAELGQSIGLDFAEKV